MLIMSLTGLYEAAKVAVLNNNYLFKFANKGVDAPYIRRKQRVKQVRIFGKANRRYGITTSDISRR